MKITRIEKWRVVVPCRPGILERRGRWHDPGLSAFDEIPKWIIRIHTDRGFAGVGESSRGESAASINCGIAALLGQDPRALPLQRLPLPAAASYATFEMALFDLLGHVWEVPAHQLLGGARQRRVLVDYWASRRSPENTAAQARAGQAAGFGSIKIKAALGHPLAEEGAAWGTVGGSLGDHSLAAAVTQDDPVVERVAAIQEACGPGFGITIDPNCRFYEPARTLRLARQLEPFNITALEDPMPWRDHLEDYVLLRQKCPLPLAIHVNHADALLQIIRARAADYLNLNGSMADFVKMAWMAELAGLRCWHGSGVDLGIRDMSYVHASIAAASCTLPGDMIGNFLREDDLITEPIPIVAGAVPLPTAPGLGVTLDEAALARYTVAE